MGDGYTDITKFRQAYVTPNRTTDDDFPQDLVIKLRRIQELKYGENPHQRGAIYVIAAINEHNTEILSQLTDLRSARTDEHGKGGLSLTNQMDVTAAMRALAYFKNPSAIIMKHTNVSGFATQTRGQSQADLFRLARDTDKRSNFGGIAVFNTALTMDAAEAMYEFFDQKYFMDVIAAPDFEEGVHAYIQGRAKNTRIGQFKSLDAIPRFSGDETYGLKSFRDLGNGTMGVQDIALTAIRSPNNFVIRPGVVDRAGTAHFLHTVPTPAQLDDFWTSWILNLTATKSNGLDTVKDGVSAALGCGTTERVGAGENMLMKGIHKAFDREGLSYDPLMGIQGWERLKVNPFKDACVSSDGFLPKGDTLRTLARLGIAGIVQPYGSVSDGEVIDAANERGICMPATLERCFLH
jgi:phosphoribosylaminoimidazolecarboxamide formyltransferase / IMP cyclohydrolase